MCRFVIRLESNTADFDRITLDAVDILICLLLNMICISLAFIARLLCVSINSQGSPGQLSSPYNAYAGHL